MFIENVNSKYTQLINLFNAIISENEFHLTQLRTYT